jgi:DNA polymerase zeta
VDLYASEAALLGALGAAVAAADPDILLGFEVQRSSLGYAAERAAALGLPSLLRALSRLPRVSRRVVLSSRQCTACCHCSYCCAGQG